MSDPAPDLSVVILSWNTRQLLSECLEALRGGLGGLSAQVVVIDNRSEDGSPEMVADRFPEVELFRNSRNDGYAIGVNLGLERARGRKLCLLGSDTRVEPDALPRLAAFLEAHPDAGAVAPRLVNSDGTTQRACMRFPGLLTALWWDTPLQAWWPRSRELDRYQMKDWDHRGTRMVDQPPGTCLMLPRKVVDAIGPMDPRLWLFFNDVDWALRIHRLKRPIWYLDDAVVLHHLGGSTRNYADFGAEWHRNRIRFYRKHHHQLGAAITKTVAAYAAFRQCWRIKRDLPFGPEYRASVKVILGTLWGILARG